MKWVVLLLAIAVILPTVCLLWFMNRAVANERLAVQQRLTEVYSRRLEEMSRQLDSLWDTRIRRIEQQRALGRTPAELFERLTQTGPDWGFVTTLLVFDHSGQLLYPFRDPQGGSVELPEAFDRVDRLVFSEDDHEGAAALYDELATRYPDDYSRINARLGQIRSLRQLGELERAIALCREVAYGPVGEFSSAAALSLAAKAKLLLLDLQRQRQGHTSQADLQELIDAVTRYAPSTNMSEAGPQAYGNVTLPSETRRFLLRKTLENVHSSPWAAGWAAETARMSALLSAEEAADALLARYHTDSVTRPWSEQESLKLMSLLSLALTKIEAGQWEWAEQFRQQLATILSVVRTDPVTELEWERERTPSWLEGWRSHVFEPITLNTPAFGPLFRMVHRSEDRTYILLTEPEQLEEDFLRWGPDLQDGALFYRVTEAGRGVVEPLGRDIPETVDPGQAALFKVSLGRFFPSWTMEVFCADLALFDRAAAQQTALTIWIGVLAIAVIVASGGLAAKVVGSQIRTNRLKNDFIATVTHELKTPLSSMRLLGDTLLEGGAQDRQQTLDYLHLMAQENERLSRLIDHFLSFSRMERNKQAFEYHWVQPTRCVHAAATSVSAKFAGESCDFQQIVEEPLADIWADEDAVVTVLVNLLDNAYKYSDEPREIRLEVRNNGAGVSFSVRDNGIGLSRRSQRKIFKRFYQVDRGLTRRVGGCGLGLSITQYIVTAHRGQISIESQPGHGSTFTVTFPTQADRSPDASWKPS